MDQSLDQAQACPLMLPCLSLQKAKLSRHANWSVSVGGVAHVALLQELTDTRCEGMWNGSTTPDTSGPAVPYLCLLYKTKRSNLKTFITTVSSCALYSIMHSTSVT